MDASPDLPPSQSSACTGPRFLTVIIYAGVAVAILLGVIGFTDERPLNWGQIISELLMAWSILVGLLAIPAWFFGWLFTRLGRWRNWPMQANQRIAHGLVIVSIATGGFIVGQAFAEVRERSIVKSLWLRGIAGALDQFFQENAARIFVNYNEIVGPQRYMRSYNSPDGADFSFQFPVRRYSTETLDVRLPDGTTIKRTPHIASRTRRGLIDTWDKPQGPDYRPDRVYLLDCDVKIRGWHVVDLPPDPTGSEGRNQDGVHIYKLPDGGRFEVTYHGGLPHGSFRAFHADGAPWGEATYRKGKVVEAWVITRSGRRFDELNDGDAASVALLEEAKAEAETLAQRGRGKLAVRDFTGAIADFTSAIDGNNSETSYYLGRLDAKLGLGDIDGAIQDCMLARNNTSYGAERTLIEQKLKELQQRKATR